MSKAFDELFQDDTRLGTKIPKERYLPVGDYPIIDQGQSYIAGYADDDAGIYSDVPAIIFGDHTRAVKYVDAPFFLGADGVKLLKGKRSDSCVKFLYYALRAARIPNTGYNRHFKWLKELVFHYPSLAEQRKIAVVLDKATALIAERKRQLEQLDLLVKSRFVEMFGDSERWEQKRLDEIATTRLGKMLDAKKQTGACTFPYLANFNVQWFGFNLERLNEMDFDESDRKEFSLEDGDLLICEGGEVGRSAIWRGERQNCFFQKALHRVRCNLKKCVPEYIAWVMYFKAHSGEFDGVASAATIAHLPGVKLKALMFHLPPLPLQEKFADFVRQVDKSKFEIQQGLETLELQYNALMQRYFG